MGNEQYAKSPNSHVISIGAMTPGSWGGKNLKKAVGSANCLLKKFAVTRVPPKKKGPS